MPCARAGSNTEFQDIGFKFLQCEKQFYEKPYFPFIFALFTVERPTRVVETEQRDAPFNDMRGTSCQTVCALRPILKGFLRGRRDTLRHCYPKQKASSALARYARNAAVKQLTASSGQNGGRSVSRPLYREAKNPKNTVVL